MNKMILAIMLVNVGIGALQAAHMSDAELKESYQVPLEAANKMLLAAVWNDDIESLNQALQLGADINKLDKAGDSVFIIAVRLGNDQIVSRLLDAPGIDLDIRGNEGQSALMWAVYIQNGNLVRKLLNAGVDINAQNRHGITALMYSAMDGDADMINMLLNHGANVTLEDNKGKTAAGHVDILPTDDEATRERKTALKNMLQKRIVETRREAQALIKQHTESKSSRELERVLPEDISLSIYEYLPKPSLQKASAEVVRRESEKAKARKLLEEHSRSKTRELKKVMPEDVETTVEQEYLSQPKPERAMREVERREQARQKIEEKALKQSQEQ